MIVEVILVVAGAGLIVLAMNEVWERKHKE